MGKVYAGDIGTKIILDTGTDLSAATAQKIYYEKPSRENGDWPAEIEGPAADGKIQHTTVLNDIEVGEHGIWKLQSYVEFSSGQKLRGETVELTIYERMA